MAVCKLHAGQERRSAGLLFGYFVCDFDSRRSGILTADKGYISLRKNLRRRSRILFPRGIRREHFATQFKILDFLWLWGPIRFLLLVIGLSAFVVGAASHPRTG